VRRLVSDEIAYAIANKAEIKACMSVCYPYGVSHQGMGPVSEGHGCERGAERGRERKEKEKIREWKDVRKRY